MRSPDALPLKLLLRAGRSAGMPPKPSLRPRQVLEEDKLGKKIAHVQFGMFGNEEVERLAEFEGTSDRGYEQPGRIPD